jgi:hypothetical protein
VARDVCPSMCLPAAAAIRGAEGMRESKRRVAVPGEECCETYRRTWSGTVEVDGNGRRSMRLRAEKKADREATKDLQR